MAEYSRHDPANSNTITQQEYEDMNAPHQPSGVIGAYGDTPTVYADGSARAVKIRANKKAKVRGRTWYNDAAEVQVTIAPNTAGVGLTRIDAVVLRLYRASQGAAPAPQAWQVRLAVVQGVASATPAAPALTQQTTSGNTVWELPLADVTVTNGAAVINAGDVKSREWYVTTDGVLVSDSSITAPTGFPVGQRWLHANTGWTNVLLPAGWRVSHPVAMPAPKSATANGTPTAADSMIETRDAVLGDYVFTALEGHFYEVRLNHLLFNAGGNVADVWGLHIRDGGAATPTAASSLIVEDTTRTMIVGAGGRRPFSLVSEPVQFSAGTHTLSFFAKLLADAVGADGSSFTPISPAVETGGTAARTLYVRDLGLLA